MNAKYSNHNVIARCPDCNGAITTFEHKDAHREYGSIMERIRHKFNNIDCDAIIFNLMRCAGCGRGGLVKLHKTTNNVYMMEQFFPTAIEKAQIPSGIPDGIVAESREAELCASFDAWRAASALLRSTLEKTLKANGYTTGSLAKRIDDAAEDGVLTEARKKRAHDDIRVLGNDVLHDEWRIITQDEVNVAHHYVQRILEDFYDDRKSVEAILFGKGRLTPE